jgi:hypothetical protein
MKYLVARTNSTDEGATPSPMKFLECLNVTSRRGHSKERCRALGNGSFS